MHDGDALLPDRRIALDVQAADRHAALGRAAALLADGDAALAAPRLRSLMQRELLGSTAIGHGIALPHGPADGGAGPAAAMLRLAEPVDFDAPDGVGVDLVIALTVPQGFAQRHLDLLAALADRCIDPDIRGQLRRTTEPGHIRRLLFGATSP